MRFASLQVNRAELSVKAPEDRAERSGVIVVDCDGAIAQNRSVRVLIKEHER